MRKLNKCRFINFNFFFYLKLIYEPISSVYKIKKMLKKLVLFEENMRIMN